MRCPQSSYRSIFFKEKRLVGQQYLSSNLMKRHRWFEVVIFLPAVDDDF